MLPVNNQPTPDEISAIAESSGVPKELLIALWDKETAQGAGLAGKQNHFGPWELTRSTYKSYVMSEAPDKFKGFPADITKATKEQILAVSAEKLKKDWEAAGGDLNKFLIRWQGNHPTIGVQDVQGTKVLQADYSTPIVAYNMEQLKQNGSDAKLARSFKDLPPEKQKEALKFYKKEPEGPTWQVDANQPTVTPTTTAAQNLTDRLDVLTGLLTSRTPQPLAQAPTLSASQQPSPAMQAYQNLLGQYNALAQKFVEKSTKSPQSIWDAFDIAAFRNYESGRMEQSLKIMQNQLANLATLATFDSEREKKATAAELNLQRQATQLQIAQTNLERAQTASVIKEIDKTIAEIRAQAARDKAAAAAVGAGTEAEDDPKKEQQQKYNESLKALGEAQANYTAMKDRLNTPQGMQAKDRYLEALRKHIDTYSQTMKQRTPTNADLASLAELQLVSGIIGSEAAVNLPSDTIDRITSHIRAKGGSVEKAIDEVFGKADADGVTLKNILRGKPNAIGENTKQALTYADPRELTPDLVRGIDVAGLAKQFKIGDSKNAQLSALLESKKSETERAIADRQESNRIAMAVASAYSKVMPYASGPLALNKKIGDTIVNLGLDPNLYPQLATIDVEEAKLIPLMAKLVRNKVISIDEASGQISQFYSDLAKRKDSITRVDRMHIALPKNWVVAFGKLAIDMTKPSHVQTVIRDEMVRQTTLMDSVRPMPELPPMFGP